MMHNVGVSRGSRGRTISTRGGIRKRGAALRVDRDGDFSMDSGERRGRVAKRNHGDPGRVDSGRSMPAGGRSQTRERTLNAIQKALSGSSESQANIRQARGGLGGGGLQNVSVRGWKHSKAALNPGGALDSVLAFLQRKLNTPDSTGPHARISKSRIDGDALIVSVRPELVDRLLSLNGISFAGTRLTVEVPVSQNMALDGASDGISPSTAEYKTKFSVILQRRYYVDSKLLDLSNLRNDPDLIAMGVFNRASSQSKFFPALMRVWEMNFDSIAKRREAVQSVSLAKNQLESIKDVTSLAQTFPDLKNLDLSDNNFKDAEALSGWRWRFRDLDFLDLSGAPFSADPTFKDTMLKWYPKLRTLNKVQVRTTEEVAAQMKSPIPVQAPYFQDEGQIAEKFITAFFASYDHNRNDLINNIYDNNSVFSFNVNTSAPKTLTETAGWDSYIKKSRNLLKINHLSARMSRSYHGSEKIREVWNTLPKTRHPDILAHPDEWLIECHPIPGLPDPAGHSETGVGGLLIMVHGNFEEEVSGKVEMRSFDRTFILGPGGSAGGLRVLSDLLCLRAYGGNEAWTLDSRPIPPQLLQTAQIPAAAAVPVAAPLPAVPGGYGVPAPGKSETQLQQEQLVLQVSTKTNMTLQYSEMALSGNGWNIEAALKNFEELKTQGKLPPEAFLPSKIAA